MNNLKKYLITGLVVVIPFSLTIYLLLVVFQFLDNILGVFLVDYLKKSWGFYVPGIGFILFVLLILLVGMLATKFLKHRIFLKLEDWFSGLPLIKNIYPALKQVILFVSAQKEFGFKKVVLVEYPSKGIWSLGFITNEGFAQLNKAIGKDTVAVFLPMSPGPLSGYTVFVSRDEVRFPDMSVNEALNIIISAGVFHPKN
jgi:uncharacterized membrane protein